MTKVYGGLLLENLVKQDKHYDLQLRLLKGGFIQGIQLLVPHPLLTPGLTIQNLSTMAANWPGELFVHYAAESRGVDFAERNQEIDIFSRYGYQRQRWRQWNEEAVRWAKEVIDKKSDYSYGVAHPGYGRNFSDSEARDRIVHTLKAVGTKVSIVLENIPPAISLYYWGFGGTPDDMHSFLQALAGWQCLIDFTHLLIMVNQANRFEQVKELNPWKDIDRKSTRLNSSHSAKSRMPSSA